jgi:adenine specific DNA methylase Mod
MNDFNKNNDIDYALVEGKRPPIYTALKYWGKKPHNIWAEYIMTYTPENGICLDPFMGSGVAFFEALRCNRKIIGFDLNPISSFIIEVLSSDFNKEKLPYSDRTFDEVRFYFVFEHLKNINVSELTEKSTYKIN